MMEATAISLLGHPKLCKPSSFLLPESSFAFASNKTLSFRSTNLITKYWTSTRPKFPVENLMISNRAFQEHDNRTHNTSDIKSRNRERLVALFKRIQRSISEAKSNNTSSAISQASNDNDSPPETSVLQFLQLSNHDTEVSRSKAKLNEASTQKRILNKETPKPIPQHPSNMKLSRLPSNFVKRSPIPSPTPLRNINLEVTNKEMQSSELDKGLPQIEGMKLVELKEVAKQKGIKGYSKLKKGELIELLRSYVNA